MSDSDDPPKRPERARSFMGDTQRSMIGEPHRVKTPAGGAPQVEVYDENSGVYAGPELENVRKRAIVRGGRDTKERVAKVEVKGDELKERVERLEGAVGEVRDAIEAVRGDVAEVLASNASVTSAFDMYIKMNPPQPAQARTTTKETVTEIVRQTTDAATTTLAARVLEREERQEKRADRWREFWSSSVVRVILGVLGGGGGLYLLQQIFGGKSHP